MVQKVVILIAMVLLFSTSTVAISDLISVNGRLMDSNGNPLNGTYSALFSFYNDSNTILVENTTILPDNYGFFTKQINVSNVSFLYPVYLGTTIANDSEMLPRTLITSVPSALYCSAWAGSESLNDNITSFLMNYVPYTGATNDVDLGTFNFSAQYIGADINMYALEMHPRAALCTGFLGSDCSHQYPLESKSNGVSGNVAKFIEYSGNEYSRWIVDSSGDMNIYADSGSIRMAILDSVARVAIGATTSGNTLGVNGNLGVGSYYSTACPTNGICSSGYNSFGLSSGVYSFVQTKSFAGTSEYITSADDIPDDKTFTYYSNRSSNVSFSLPKCGDKYAVDRVYNIKFYDGNSTTSNVTIMPLGGEQIEHVLNGVLTLEDVGDSVTIQCLGGDRDITPGWIILASHNAGDFAVK